MNISNSVKKKTAPESASERSVSRSTSAASLGPKRIEGRVKGRFCGCESVVMRDLRACNWEAMDVAMAARVLQNPETQLRLLVCGWVQSGDVNI